jgi:hypothetical protein
MVARQYTYTEDIQQEAMDTYYRRRGQKKSKKKSDLKQKLFGLLMVLFGVLIPFVADGDVTMSLLIVPMGLYILFTKEKVLMDCEM